MFFSLFLMFFIEHLNMAVNAQQNHIFSEQEVQQYLPKKNIQYVKRILH